MEKGSPLPIVYVVVFLAFFDTFALLPTVGPYAASIGAGGFGIGVAVGAYSLSGLVFNVVGGVLLDRVGRRPLAVAGLAVAAVAVSLYALAASPVALVGVRLLHGAGGGVLVPALFTIAGDLAPEQRRGSAMGRAGAFIGLAAVVGPAVAGPLRGAAGFTAVFALVTGALAVGALLAAFRLPETHRPPEARAERSSRTPSLARLLGRVDLRLAIAAVFGFTSAFGTLAAFLPDQVEALGSGPAIAGALFTLVSGIAAMLMLSRAARWVDRVGAAPPVRAGMLLFLVALVLLAVARTLPPVLVASGVFGVGFGLLFPAATGAVAIAAPVAGRGRAFGLFNAAYSLGFILVPPAAGALADRAGASPYLLPAVVCGVVLLASGRPWRRGELTAGVASGP
jgi:MFS transporter, DHA1 family, multidrug resistance protein